MTSAFEFSLKWVATWFGCGRSKYAPGTVGTLGAIPLVWLFSFFNPVSYMIATFAFVVFAILVAQAYEVLFADEHDPSEFVLDEVAGFLVTMTWVPFTVAWVVPAFVLFRLFDAIKPFPISWVDAKVPGGVGAVADDLVAGIAANVVLQVVLQKGYEKFLF